MTASLDIAAVSFAYGRQTVLVDVTFALQPGERVALVGHNGAGKSTLMRLITGLVKPTAGMVRVGDWDTRAHRPEELAHRVGSLFQHADQQLFARTVRDDVAFGPHATRVPAAEATRRVARALVALGLEAVAHEHPYDLPPPERKLAALAGALALEPSLLVLDEPTAGLDRRARARVAAALADRAAEGATLLVITHDLEFAAETLERGLVLDHGRLAVDAPLSDLLGRGNGLAGMGLEPPPLSRLSTALALPGHPIRARDVAAGLASVAARNRVS
ncbi:MAG TPA: ABC transporter ATP-binding protein [Gemmatimonadales bacterium]|nr:ABC transporter ATP-binding protein [Gemmatimonadales bacterium]